MRLGRDQGLEVLPALLSLAPGLHIIVVTAYATIENAVEAMRRGAFDYLPKPFTPNGLRAALERSLRVRRLQQQVNDLEEQVHAVVPEADLRTVEPVQRQALEVAFKAAASDAVILLAGESGTGKSVVARAIHARSPRAAGPFVTVHCPSLSAELLESDLFGHARGAFTGAVKDTAGKVAAADGGTLFLDEVGDLPPAIQPKLLRLLQEKRDERVGETQTRAGDVRIVAASNRDLAAEVAAGRFREDLLYRLNVIEVTLPPLRQRVGDILPLAEGLLAFFAQQAGKRLTGFTPEARSCLARYAWPGNLRELRNAVERGAILAAGPLVGLSDLPVFGASDTSTTHRPNRAAQEPERAAERRTNRLKNLSASASITRHSNPASETILTARTPAAPASSRLPDPMSKQRIARHFDSVSEHCYLILSRSRNLHRQMVKRNHPRERGHSGFLRREPPRRHRPVTEAMPPRQSPVPREHARCQGAPVDF